MAQAELGSFKDTGGVPRPVLGVAIVNPDGGAPNTQGAQTKVTLVAATAATLLAASTEDRRVTVLNYIDAPVYVAPGVTGTPASTAPSDYIPAAAAGVPGRYTCPYSPKSGLRVISANAGDLTLIVA